MSTLTTTVRLEPDHSSAPIIGSFGKGVDGAISINFSTSAGRNCDPGCDVIKICYADRIENRPDRAPLLAKLQRHEQMDPAEVCGRALFEISELINRRRYVPWVRISTAGSVPPPSAVTPQFRARFRALLAYCKRARIPVHFPLELGENDKRKVRFYRALVGDLVTVRESVGTRHGRLRQQTGPASAVVDSPEHRPGKVYRARIEAAKQLASKLRASGKSCVVCPAVIAGFKKRMKGENPSANAKCGSCTACATDVDVILYPLH